MLGCHFATPGRYDQFMRLYKTAGRPLRLTFVSWQSARAAEGGAAGRSNHGGSGLAAQPRSPSVAEQGSGTRSCTGEGGSGGVAVYAGTEPVGAAAAVIDPLVVKASAEGEDGFEDVELVFDGRGSNDESGTGAWAGAGGPDGPGGPVAEVADAAVRKKAARRPRGGGASSPGATASERESPGEEEGGGGAARGDNGDGGFGGGGGGGGGGGSAAAGLVALSGVRAKIDMGLSELRGLREDFREKTPEVSLCCHHRHCTMCSKGLTAIATCVSRATAKEGRWGGVTIRCPSLTTTFILFQTLT